VGPRTEKMCKVVRIPLEALSLPIATLNSHLIGDHQHTFANIETAQPSPARTGFVVRFSHIAAKERYPDRQMIRPAHA
jgi:hypothetical protein